jgi:hypothetical protein
MVKLIVKTIVINGKIHNNKRKRFYSSNKESLITGHIQCKQSVTKKLGIEGEFPNAQMIIYLRRH